MVGSISFLSLAAVAFYAVVALACMAACGTATTSAQPRWNRNVWLALAILFVVLIVLRGLGIEEWLRQYLRDLLRSGGNYEARRTLQGVIASLVLLVVAALAGWWLLRSARRMRGRRNMATVAALVAGGAMVFLVLLRLISLHMIDQALYGAFKLNWVVDIGSSVVVLIAAVAYVRLVRARP